MTFARPDWLWLLVPAALCLGCAWTASRRRRAVAAGFATTGVTVTLEVAADTHAEYEDV